MKRSGVTGKVLLLILITSPGYTQEKAPEDFIKLPELRAYKLTKDEYLVFNARVPKEYVEFLRELRKVNAVHPEGTPSSLIIEKYLGKKALAVETTLCYFESDWLTNDDLALLAAIAGRTIVATQSLFGNTWTHSIKEVILSKPDEYHRLFDKWCDSDAIKKRARQFDSVFVGEYRCGYRSQVAKALSIVVADSVSRNLPSSFFAQDALREGLHTLIGSTVTLNYETYVAADVTTPSSREVTAINSLFESAREYLSRPHRDSLELVLKSELNVLN